MSLFPDVEQSGTAGTSQTLCTGLQTEPKEHSRKCSSALLLHRMQQTRYFTGKVVKLSPVKHVTLPTESLL